MSASKNRPRWNELPPYVRGQIECLVGSRVVAAQNCDGGFSPGFASRLALAAGGPVFVKAIDVVAWPSQALAYRDEARVAAGLTEATAAGAEPARPWRLDQLAQVAATISRMSAALTPSPLVVPGDHPRLGGWAAPADYGPALTRLRPVWAWAARHIDQLIMLERRGLVAAQGPTLVHFDALPQAGGESRH